MTMHTPQKRVLRDLSTHLTNMQTVAITLVGLSTTRTLREAQKALSDTTYGFINIPFYGITSWKEAKELDQTLLTMITNIVALIRETQTSLAFVHPISDDTQARFQAIRAHKKALLRFLHSARMRLRMHVHMVKDLDAMRQELAQGSTLLMERPTSKLALQPKDYALIGRTIPDQATMIVVENAVAEAYTRLTGK